jgi:NADH-quinone oxidoreductase subunit N
MTLQVSSTDLLTAGPMILVACTGLLVLVLDAMIEKAEALSFWVSLTGLVAALVWCFAGIGLTGVAFGGMLSTGGYGSFFGVVFAASGILSVMLSRSYTAREGIAEGEYYVLLLFAVDGMMLMAAAADLVIFFLGLELMSLCFYILAGFARKRSGSNEAALKYFLLGAFATGFLLYGIALVYGTAGTTNIAEITSKAMQLTQSPLFIVGLGLLMIGLVFKVAGVPFHMWVPDVYEGAPTTVSGFMSTAGKAAAFSAFLLIFAPKIVGAFWQLRDVLAVVAALSMVVGNVIAISQSNVKRMLAYSSIAHAGYILTGIVAANSYGSNGVLFYLAAYTVMNVGAFGVLSLLETEGGKRLTFDEYVGLGNTKPFVAGLMALFMFSLAGIPPFAGFFGKYYVFAGAVEAGFTWLAILGVVMSIVSAYYYLRLVVVMYFREPAGPIAEPVNRLAVGALVLSAAAILGLGLFPTAVLNLTSHFF